MKNRRKQMIENMIRRNCDADLRATNPEASSTMTLEDMEFFRKEADQA